MSDGIYRPDRSLKGKLRRRLVRLQTRRPARFASERPMVSFAFDDAPATAITAGGPILKQHGLCGSYFIAAGLAGLSGHMGPYATRAQVEQAADAGHEVACHTFSHMDCGQADLASVEADLDHNIETLRSWGFERPTTFAYPFGDVNASSKRACAQRFRLSRTTQPGVIRQGSDLNQAPAVGIEGEDGEAKARGWLQRARGRRCWLILFTHGVETTVTPFGASIEGFTRLVQDALAWDFDVVTVNQGVRRMQGLPS